VGGKGKKAKGEFERCHCIATSWVYAADRSLYWLSVQSHQLYELCLLTHLSHCPFSHLSCLVFSRLTRSKYSVSIHNAYVHRQL